MRGLRNALPFVAALLVAALLVALASRRNAPGVRGADGVPDVQATRVEVLEDAAGAMRPESIGDRAFVPWDGARANRGYTASTFWMRLLLTNPSKAARSAVLELSQTPEHAELYDEHGTLLEASGTALPFYARPVQHTHISFRLILGPGESRTVLVRLDSRDNMTLAPKVWSEEAFVSSLAGRRIVDGIYYGVLIGLGIYNLFLAYATRDRAYVAYVVFQATTALSIAAIDKYAFQYLWPAHPVWALRSEQVLDLAALAAALFCARWLLDTRRFAPGFDRLFRVLGPIVLLLAAGASALDPFPAMLMGVAATFGLGVCLLVIAATVVTLRGNPNGRIFFVGWGLLLVGVVGAGLNAMGVVEGFVGFSLLKAGSAAEAILLSLGLAARIRAAQRARADAQDALLVERSLRIDALAQLVGGVAHELGNPLNFARGGAAALAPALAELGEAEGGRARRALGLVDAGLNRIARMVEHLRADLGGRSTEAARVDLVSELDESLEALAPWLAAREVVVRRSSPASLHVLARRGDLAQVFSNLLRNGADAMPSGGTLTVSVTRAGRRAEVSVVDEGPGVAGDVAERIFEPFFTTRADAQEAGMGLGLFVARQIVARWGGSLVLEASPRGAAFVVSVPLDGADDAADSAEVAPLRRDG